MIWSPHNHWIMTHNDWITPQPLDHNDKICDPSLVAPTAPLRHIKWLKTETSNSINLVIKRAKGGCLVRGACNVDLFSKMEGTAVRDPLFYLHMYVNIKSTIWKLKRGVNKIPYFSNCTGGGRGGDTIHFPESSVNCYYSR